jgi:Ca2+-binding RTX toxin-like protein
MKKTTELIPGIKTLAILASAGMLTLALGSLAIPRTANADHCGNATCSPSTDLAFDMEDMNFILDQIKISERHAAGEDLADILPNLSIPWGLRTVDGSFNNLIPGQEGFGAADLEFGQAAGRVFPDAQASIFPPNLPTTYNSAENVTDSTPRLISHLITNQSVMNPAAVSAAAAEGGVNIGPDIAGADQLFIPNTAPDEGLSAPFNAYMTFFGQFFDHGLDLINKGGNGTVFMPLQQDDPLFDPGPDGDPNTTADNGPNFMAMTRATRGAGPDGIVGTEDDVFINATTPHVDQQQTYASHASAQILLRHYDLVTAGRTTSLQNSGKLLNGFGNDRILDTADDGGMATWDTVKAQARLKMGILLDDQDGKNVPMILSDLYGNFIPGPRSGLPQLVTSLDPLTTVEGSLGRGVDATQALRVNQNFFLDVAHTAAPNGQPDVDTVINPRIDILSGQRTRGVRAAAPDGFYDDELLGAHFMCGDGRCNENIALTTVHSIFHHEHNRLSYVAKRVLLDSGNLATLNEWLDTPLRALPAWDGLPFAVSDASLAHQDETQAAIDALGLDWNGGRIFQAARFGTEMQYNRIVFDEFAPTLSGLKDAFSGFHTNVNPVITAEFSQSVYRFGHSMLTQTVDRFDPDFNPITDPFTNDATQLGLFEAFLNPLALYNADENGVATLTPEQGTGAVIRGVTRTIANEIDEFVDGSLQNNLVGLPLDLGALNIARGRDVGNPPLNAARRMFFKETQDTRLMPYANWADYADNMRHEASLVNFIAAYGKHPTLAGVDRIVGNGDDPVSTFADRRAAACAIVGKLSADAVAYCEANGFGTPPATPVDAMDFLFGMGDWSDDANGLTTTGLDDVDFWNGGLAEERMPFGGYLGSTHNFVFESQIESLQNGDRFYYLGRTANIHLLTELESNSFAALVMRSTDVEGGLPLNLFSVPAHILEVDQTRQFDAAGDATTADPVGDAELTPLVIRDVNLLSTNIAVLDSTRVLQYTGGDHVTMTGTVGSDTIVGGIGDDAILGGSGNDRLEGGDGNDLIEGGAGDDIITDLSGFDVIEGGSGNDAISSGNGEDVIFGDDGNDFIVNPSELGEIFGGLGDDFILDGMHLGHTRGGAGNDWMENLGGGEDLFQGDNGAAPEAGEPTVIGHDVGIAYGGNNDFDMENGDDIVVDGPGIERVEGQSGFDWVSFQNDRFGVDVDLDLTIFDRPQIPPSNNTVLNRYDRVEGVSGSPFADILRGTENPAGADLDNELVIFDLVEGLVSSDGVTPCAACIVPVSELSILASGNLGWSGGELILGGAGSDVMTGRGGDDIIDGDAALQVSILTPDPAVRSGPVGQALVAAKAEANRAASQAVLDANAVVAFDELQAAAIAAADAAQAAADVALAAADAADAAQAGLSSMTVTDSLGNLISAAVLGAGGDSIKDEWNNFLASCSAALRDLGWDVDTSKRELAVALATQAAELSAQATLDLAAMEATRDASAARAVTAAAELVVAQANLDAVDVMINVDSMLDIQDAVFAGYINPGELSISRVISDHDAGNQGTDVAVYTGNRGNYLIGAMDPVTGYIEVTDTRVPTLDGRDLVRNVERLQFSDQTLLIAGTAGGRPGGNNSLATGQPEIIGDGLVPAQVLTATLGTVTDADNVSSGGLVTTKVAWNWQVELDPGTGDFTNIVREGTGDAVEATGPTLVLELADIGLLIRVRGLFQDEAGALETVTSAAVLAN